MARSRGYGHTPATASRASQLHDNAANDFLRLQDYATTFVMANCAPLHAQSAVVMRSLPVPATASAGYSSCGSYNDPMSATYVSPANLHQPQQAAVQF